MSRYQNGTGVKSRSSSKSGLKKKISLSVWEAKFYIQEDKSKPSYAEFKIQKYIDSNMTGPEYIVRVGMISCWVDFNTNYCVKAHLYPSVKSLDQLNFLKDLQQAGEVSISSAAGGNNGMSTLLASDQMILAPEKTGRTAAIRYGWRSQGIFKHRGTYLEDYKSYEIYDTKAIAIEQLIDHLRIRKTIGGLSMVNFMRIPDDILESVGYEPVPDLLGRGFPMWKGNPESVSEASSAQRYGTTQHEKQTSNAESFLELVQKAIS